MSKRIIISASSDIGRSMANRWVEQGHSVIGTFRNHSSKVVLEDLGVAAIPCNLNSRFSTRAASKRIIDLLSGSVWNTLVLAAGTQTPVGMFRDNRFQDWSRSVTVNFIRQVQVVHALLPHAAIGAQVLFFAGGGTNGAVKRYSAYTISKIASIKLCELLAAEEPEIRFTSIGPGWVRTKIHQETFNAGQLAGENLEAANQRFATGDFFPMNDLLDKVDWILNAPAAAVNGRNFSAVHDPFEDSRFTDWLLDDENRFKLRRLGNNPNLS